MSKQKLLFLALATALSCLGQQNRTATTSLGTNTEYVSGTAGIYNGSAFSPNLTYGLYVRNNQLWRLNISTGETTSVVNPATQSYTYTAFNQIAESGIALIYGSGPDGIGTYRINLDGTINPVLVHGQILTQGTVTYPGNPVLTRDGSKASMEGYLNNQFCIFLYTLSTGSISVISSTNSPLDPAFQAGLYSSESSLRYGYWQEVNKSSPYRLATMDLDGKLTTLVNPLPVLNGNTYALSRDGVTLPVESVSLSSL